MNQQRITCEASNSIASVKASSQLNIIYKPFFSKGTHSFVVLDKHTCNKPVTLDCQVDANPSANITWYKIDRENQEKIHIGYGPTYTIASLSCGNSKIFGHEQSVNDYDLMIPSHQSSSSKLKSFSDDELIDYYRLFKTGEHGDFGMYSCEATNGVSDENSANTWRKIKLNPLGEPVLSLVVDENSPNQVQTSSYVTKKATLGSSILLTCIIEPQPHFKNVIWVRDEANFIANSQYRSDEFVARNEVFENEYLSSNEESEMGLKNVRIDNLNIKYENTSEGLKSYLHVKLLKKDDFGLYKCKAWNKYGSKEVVIQIKESQLNDIFVLKPLFAYLLLACLVVLILVFVLIVIVICMWRRRSSSGKSDKDLISSNEMNEENSDKTINEWLATSSKLSNNTALSNSQACVNYDKAPNDDFLLSGTNKNASVYSSLLGKSVKLTSGNELESSENDNEDFEEDFSKMLHDTTYRLSDLFKDLTPNLLNSSSPIQNQLSNENLLETNTSKPFQTSYSPNDNVKSGDSTKMLNFKMNFGQSSCGVPASFLMRSVNTVANNSSSTISPPYTAAPAQYQTKIHANMKNIPYTTLSKHYNNATAQHKVNPSKPNSSIKTVFDDNSNKMRTEIINGDAMGSKSKSDAKFQTIV